MEKKVRNCKCNLCKRHTAFEKFKDKYPFTKKDKAFLEKIYEDLNMTEFDRDYYMAIMDGSWPQAVEILERHLFAAKKMRAVQEKKNVKNL